MRLDKFLCECNIGTRSEVKKIIKSGAITVNSAVIKKADVKINEIDDVICYQGKKLSYEKYSYYLFHKPAGCVTAKTDNLHKTVMDFFPDDIRKDLAPVGRLDLDTEGLLLITNDGALTHHLLSPAHHVEKTYYALLDKPVEEGSIPLFETGIDIGDDKPTLPAILKIIDGCVNYRDLELYPVELTISEGRFHQVKRMFEAVGSNVIYLKRLSMGSLVLGNLEIGEYRKLSEEEIADLS